MTIPKVLRRCLFGGLVFTALGATAGGLDSDADGLEDNVDNCVVLANADQRDTDNDGIGNACDADLNQDCTVNVVDLGVMRSVFFSSNANADLNGDGVVNISDLGILRAQFFGAPGPSGIINDCASVLTINGRVPGALLSGGTVTATVDGGSGGGEVMFATGLAGDGSFSVDVFAPAGDGFVTLAANGTGSQAPLLFQSLAGSIGALTEAGGNDGTVDQNDVAALNVSEVTTALAALARERNGELIQDDDALDSSIGAVDSSLLIELAALVRLYAQSPELVASTGQPNTVALLEIPPLREFLLDAFRSLVPESVDDAAMTSAETLRQAYPTTFAGGRLLVSAANNLQSFGARVIDLQAGGVAQYVTTQVAGSGTWLADGDGQIRVNFPVPLVQSESLLTVEDPANPGVFIEAVQQTLVEQLVVERLIDGVLADHIFVKQTTRVTFPDVPGIPDVVTFEDAGRSTARLAFDGANPFPLSAANLVSDGQVLSYYHRDNASEGSADVRRGVDTLDFEPDGTGSTRRRGFGFSWVLSPDALDITFDNGDVNRFEYLFDDFDGLPSLIVVSDMVGEPTVATRALLLARDESVAFDAVNIPNRRFRSSLAADTTQSQVGRVFDFMFDDVETACRNPGSASSTWTYSLLENRVDILRTFSFNPLFFFSRTWEPVQARSDGYWVMETLQIVDDEPIVDAGVTPGRLNFYSLEQSLAGNSRPTLISDPVGVGPGTNRVFAASLFVNDIDPEGDQIIMRGVDSVSANGATVTPIFDTYGLITGFDYEALPGFVGIDTVSYQASDLFCFSDPTVTGTVEFVYP